VRGVRHGVPDLRGMPTTFQHSARRCGIAATLGQCTSKRLVYAEGVAAIQTGSAARVATDSTRWFLTSFKHPPHREVHVMLELIDPLIALAQ